MIKREMIPKTIQVIKKGIPMKEKAITIIVGIMVVIITKVVINLKVKMVKKVVLVHLKSPVNLIIQRSDLMPIIITVKLVVKGN